MYFFRTFVKELRRDMKKNPKKHHLLGSPPVFDVNHIIKGGGGGPLTQSEIDEADDKFDTIEDGDDNTDLYIDLPEEKTSLLSDDEAHNAPTL